MPRNLYPVRFYVEFTGDAALCEWEGFVSAKSRDAAIAVAASRARDEGVLFVENTHVRITREE
jgi:hypothetical protein